MMLTTYVQILEYDHMQMMWILSEKSSRPRLEGQRDMAATILYANDTRSNISHISVFLEYVFVTLELRPRIAVLFHPNYDLILNYYA